MVFKYVKMHKKHTMMTLNHFLKDSEKFAHCLNLPEIINTIKVDCKGHVIELLRGRVMPP